MDMGTKSRIAKFSKDLLRAFATACQIVDNFVRSITSSCLSRLGKHWPQTGLPSRFVPLRSIGVYANLLEDS